MAVKGRLRRCPDICAGDHAWVAAGRAQHDRAGGEDEADVSEQSAGAVAGNDRSRRRPRCVDHRASWPGLGCAGACRGRRTEPQHGEPDPAGADRTRSRPRRCQLDLLGGAAATGSCHGAARPSPLAAWCTGGDGRAQPGRRRHRHARRARPAARHRVHRTAAPAGRPDPLPPRTRNGATSARRRRRTRDSLRGGRRRARP